MSTQSESFGRRQEPPVARALGLNLVTASVEQVVRERAPWIGRQLQPRHCGGIEQTVAAGFPWSADNGCFHGFDEPACRAMWARLAGWPGCRFVVVPDVVADHHATLRMWEQWWLIVRELTGGQLAILCDSFDGTKWARWSVAHRPVGDAAQTTAVQLAVPGT